MGLETQTPNFWITIRKNKHLTKEQFDNFLSKNEGVKIYAYIEHKNDKSKETGEIEGIHYHMLLIRKKTRINTMYNLIRDSFNFDNVNGVRVEVAKSAEGCIQYLLHKNDPLKTPHELKEIKSNLCREELLTYIETEDNTLTFQKVYNLCMKYDDIVYVIQEVGFTRYNLYRNTIRDIWNSCDNKKRVAVLKEQYKQYKNNGVTVVKQS